MVFSMPTPWRCIDVVPELTFAIQLLLVPAALMSVIEICYMPLALWSRARVPYHRAPLRGVLTPMVSVIVPAYNEGVLLARCVESILQDRYQNKEVIVVDDGSSDDTWDVMKQFRGRPHVTLLRQANAGKAVALNKGMAQARGEVLMFVDADGVFSEHTIKAMLAGFDDPRVGAVCGNDAPVNLNRLQPQLLTLLTHVTAMVRRALAQVNCLTIVSGNCGAIRREVLHKIGGFTPGLLGEDLELTWRVREAGYRVSFQPTAMVYAEVPATMGSLWRQRVRWARGYVQTLRMHKNMLGNPHFGVLGMYLVINVVSMVVAPILQLSALVLIVVVAVEGGDQVYGVPVTTVSWVLFALPLVSVAVAATLNGAFKDLRFGYILIAMPIYSLGMNLVLMTALAQELRHAPSKWNKLKRTGVSSRAGIPESVESA